MERSLEDQQAQKMAWVGRIMKRTPDRLVPSPTLLHTRARIRLRTDGAGRAGYHQPRSHWHVPIDHCPIARPEIDALISTLPALPGVETLELRSDGTRVVAAATRRGAGRGALEALQGLEGGGLAGVALDGREIWGEVETALTVGEIHHRLSPETFYQVHLALNEVLVAEVGAAIRPGAAVLDLYAGAGNLSLPLAARGHRVLMIESNPRAAADARRTAARHGLDVEIRTGDAGRFQAGEAWFEVAILDPPRAGAPGVIAQLLLTRPERIVVVCCHPPTLPRDLQPALAAGYRVKELVLFDLFPHTPHVEVLVVLER